MTINDKELASLCVDIARLAMLTCQPMLNSNVQEIYLHAGELARHAHLLQYRINDVLFAEMKNEAKNRREPQGS